MSIVLTGIKPTGELHLGNYLGALRPALERSRGHDGRFFIADVHALNQGLSGEALRTNTLAVAAAWIAGGLDLDSALLYRQSDVPEVLELAAYLTTLCPKGLMNRAHAYKASVAENTTKGRDPDKGVNMGLFTYPILMAADILAFDTDLVPVGSDQVQHVEIAVDIAQTINRAWRAPLLQEPKAWVEPSVALVPGPDGKKMSKSHGNVIPLFADRDELRRRVRQVPTDSSPLGAPKDPEATVLTAWMRSVAPGRAEDFAARLRSGNLGWGVAKDEVAEALDQLVAPLRRRYHEILADLESLERQLQKGAEVARCQASKVVARVKKAALGR